MHQGVSAGSLSLYKKNQPVLLTGKTLKKKSIRVITSYTYIHIYLHTYIHIYLHTYVDTGVLRLKAEHTHTHTHVPEAEKK